MFPNEILTERLHLRPASEADAERMFHRYSRDPEVTRYLNWKPHRSMDDTLEYLRRIAKENEQGASPGYLIFAQDTGQLLGSIGGAVQESRIQFGYCLARDAWGQGFATEAGHSFVGAAIDQPEIWRVQAYCDLENRASARVLEKIGLALEGTLRRYMVLPNLGSEPRDVFCYAKVR